MQLFKNYYLVGRIPLKPWSSAQAEGGVWVPPTEKKAEIWGGFQVVAQKQPDGPTAWRQVKCKYGKQDK